MALTKRVGAHSAKSAPLTRDESTRAIRLVEFMRQLLAEIDAPSHGESSKSVLLRGLLSWGKRAPYGLIEQRYSTAKVVRNAVLHCRRALNGEPRAIKALTATIHDLVSRDYVVNRSTRDAARDWRSRSPELEQHVKEHLRPPRRGQTARTKRAIEVIASLTGRNRKTIQAANTREELSKLFKSPLSDADSARANAEDIEARRRMAKGQ